MVWKDHYDNIFQAMGIDRKKVEEQGLIELEYSTPYVF
jgi:hypothetical protein